MRIIPTEPMPVDPAESLPPAETLVEKALRSRPDLALARLQLENSRVLLEGSRNALKPSLDLVVSARNNGLAGDVNPLTLPGAGSHLPLDILVLLSHKRLVPQNGQQGSCLASALAIPSRRVAIECGSIRRPHACAAPGPVSFRLWRQGEIELSSTRRGGN
ncbi:MAG: hypothetical protein ACP5U2_06085, partial [Bryobacteraceae bacterium]